MLSASAFAETPARPAIDATTADGQAVRLLPNGRWEYVDAAKAAEARRIAEEYPENRTRPIESQGASLGGLGRYVMPGDKDYNRGSLNPKLR